MYYKLTVPSVTIITNTAITLRATTLDRHLNTDAQYLQRSHFQHSISAMQTDWPQKENTCIDLTIRD